MADRSSCKTFPKALDPLRTESHLTARMFPETIREFSWLEFASSAAKTLFVIPKRGKHFQGAMRRHSHERDEESTGGRRGERSSDAVQRAHRDLVVGIKREKAMSLVCDSPMIFS